MQGICLKKICLSCAVIGLLVTGCGKEDELEFTFVEPMPVDDLIAQLPEPWNEKTPQVPDEKNGYVYLSGLLKVDHSAVPPVSSADPEMTDDRARELVSTYQPWFYELEIALEMEFWQAPLPDNGVETLFPELVYLKRIQHALKFAARFALEDNRTDDAVRLLLLSDQFADRQLLAGGSLIHFLLGLAIDAIGDRAMNESVLTGKLSLGQIEKLLETTEDPGVLDGVRTALKDEVHGMLGFEIAKMGIPASIDAGLWGEGSTDERYQEWERVMKEVFIGHPDPFDQLDTVVILTEIFDELLDSLDGPYDTVSSPDELLEEKTDLWRVRQLEDHLAFGDWTPEKVESIRQRIKSESNPFGQLMIRILVVEMNPLEVSCVASQTRLEMMRCCLGLRVYEERFGEFPQTLEELVAAGLAPYVPWDHFADRPLQFDTKRRVIWSFGPDMVDDNGEGDHFKREPDIVIPF